MEPKFHDLDPNGDTLLILRNPNAPFLVHAPPTSPPQKRLKLESTCGEPEVRMRLSSKHLVLASAYFQKSMNAFKNTVVEGEYSYTINAQDYDENALLILMNIIHGKTGKLPLSVNHEILAKISLMVDYYQCHGAVRFFNATWLNNMDEVPEEGKDALYKFCTSWVFSDAEAFLRSTAAFIQTSREPLGNLGLPIPQQVIDSLNKQREAHISAILAGFHKLVKEEYPSDKVACTFVCDCLCLGALITKLVKLGLFDPAPLPPYAGHSMSSLDDIISEIASLPFQSICPVSKSHKYRACQALYKPRAIVNGEVKRVKGLKLKEFIDLPEST